MLMFFVCTESVVVSEEFKVVPLLAFDWIV